jgi:hypothetical protein
LLTRIAIAALVLSALLDVVGLIADVSYYDLIHRITDGQPVSPADAQSADQLQSTIGWVEIGVYLATATAFIAWFHRAYSNLRRLDGGSARWGTGWAIGAWFVPFLNFVRPRAIAIDIWIGSDPARPKGRPPLTEKTPWFLSVWWAVFIFSGLLGRVVVSEEERHALSSATRLETVADAVGIVAAALAVVVVYRIFTRQRDRGVALANLSSA